MTELIEWKDHFSLGIAEVDFEHREMIDLINRLYASMQAGAGADEVHEFLAEVHARISAHFALEERLMRRMGYAEYSAHKDDHERLLDDILDIIDDCAAAGRFDADDLARRLDRWFTDHFRTFDARLHEAAG